jgi:hypothetical protein
MLQELKELVYQSKGNRGQTVAIPVDTMVEYVAKSAKDRVWVQGTLTAHHSTPLYTTIHHHTLQYTTTPPYTTAHHLTLSQVTTGFTQ